MAISSEHRQNVMDTIHMTEPLTARRILPLTETYPSSKLQHMMDDGNVVSYTKMLSHDRSECNCTESPVLVIPHSSCCCLYHWSLEPCWPATVLSKPARQASHEHNDLPVADQFLNRSQPLRLLSRQGGTVLTYLLDPPSRAPEVERY